ncbi:hypothetical protein BJX61DRAFT_37198 [Aspergillus egyptiacus]|nr:hypothetical protein BJX61DRAFT_37198 [Aspergillus egyptiacus]
MAQSNPNVNINNNDQRQRNPESRLTFYPAFCFKASPTHFAWVKMGAADVHRLERRVEFGGLFFYNNHPIRFVNLLGLIVSRTDVPRRTILTLDDSSGAVIEVVVLKADTPPSTSASASASLATKTNLSAAAAGNDESSAPATASHITSTTRAPIDITSLQPGKLFQIKGTLSIFRQTVQVQLERFFSVVDTTAEMRFLEARCRFLVEVLSVPWVLDGEDIERLRREADEEERRVEEEQARVRRRGRRREEREERQRRKIEKGWEREEEMREREARVAREVGREFMLQVQKGRAERAFH